MTETMTKQDFQTLANELREGTRYPDTDTDVLFGCALTDYPKGLTIRKEVFVEFLRWQCIYLNGGTDEKELSFCFEVFKAKKMMMI
jgi:hypothetical protein